MVGECCSSGNFFIDARCKECQGVMVEAPRPLLLRRIAGTNSSNIHRAYLQNNVHRRRTQYSLIAGG